MSKKITAKITTDYIKLTELMKLTRISGSGGEARAVIEEGLVSVDGEVESRIRRKIYPGMEAVINIAGGPYILYVERE